MDAQLYLVAPTDLAADGAAARLVATLDAMPVAALLLRPDGTASFAEAARPLAAAAQDRGCAVLVEDDLDLVRALGADGVHVTGGLSALKAALAALKPDLIVGAGGIGSRDDAMALGEAGADYLLFGAPQGETDRRARDMAQWWAETFEVPAVWLDPAAAGPEADAAGCEFLGLGAGFWREAAAEAGA